MDGFPQYFHIFLHPQPLCANHVGCPLFCLMCMSVFVIVDLQYCSSMCSALNFDLFVALDVLIYVGDVESIFRAVHKHSNHESMFVFSTEIQEESGYDVRKCCYPSLMRFVTPNCATMRPILYDDKFQ